jgi:hypothetical protein
VEQGNVFLLLSAIARSLEFLVHSLGQALTPSFSPNFYATNAVFVNAIVQALLARYGQQTPYSQPDIVGILGWQGNGAGQLASEPWIVLLQTLRHRFTHRGIFLVRKDLDDMVSVLQSSSLTFDSLDTILASFFSFLRAKITAVQRLVDSLVV